MQIFVVSWRGAQGWLPWYAYSSLEKAEEVLLELERDSDPYQEGYYDIHTLKLDAE